MRRIVGAIGGLVLSLSIGGLAETARAECLVNFSPATGGRVQTFESQARLTFGVWSTGIGNSTPSYDSSTGAVTCSPSGTGSTTCYQGGCDPGDGSSATCHQYIQVCDQVMW